MVLAANSRTGLAGEFVQGLTNEKFIDCVLFLFFSGVSRWLLTDKFCHESHDGARKGCALFEESFRCVDEFGRLGEEGGEESFVESWDRSIPHTTPSDK